MLPIIVASFVASVVTGALGYGFSSITVPVALLFVSNRVLNPALVPIEVAMNAWILWINRESLPKVWRRASFILLGLPLGIWAGTSALIAIDPAWLKLMTFAALLPLILLQAAGFRRAIKAERAVGALFGSGVGTLYAVTTISGPPLAMFLNNQGFAKSEFRAALALIRFTAASITVALYAESQLFTETSFNLLLAILPGVIIGVPLGGALIKRVEAESFRRICMSFDAAIVSFGISVLLHSLKLVPLYLAFIPFAAVLVYDAYVLRRYFRSSHRSLTASSQQLAS